MLYFPLYPPRYSVLPVLQTISKNYVVLLLAAPKQFSVPAACPAAVWRSSDSQWFARGHQRVSRPEEATQRQVTGDILAGQGVFLSW